MSDSGWTKELVAERNAQLERDIAESREQVIKRGKRFLSEQERVRAAKEFVGALSQLATPPGGAPRPWESGGTELRPAKAKRKPRAHPERDPGQPKWNKTEALYARHLEIQKNFHRIVWWAFEGMTLKLAPDTRYTPDFAIMTADHRLEFHEVKGAKKGKPRYEDDARVKIACAAEKFRPVRFVMVWPARNGEWDCKEF